jgi:outer membrane receptor protein involved in Fe transport
MPFVDAKTASNQKSKQMILKNWLNRIDYDQSQSIYVLPQITIKSNQKSQKSTDQTSISDHPSRTTITEQNIDSSGAQSIQSALSIDANVQSTNSTGDNPLYKIRGHQASVLIDGHPINKFESSAPMTNLVPMSSVKKVQISSHSASVLYGNVGLGGTINLVTKKSSQMQDQITISPSWPHYGQIELTQKLDVPKPWSMSLSHTSKNQKSYRDFSRRITTATSIQSARRLANGIFRFKFNVATQNLRFPGPLDQKQINNDPWQKANGREKLDTQALKAKSSLKLNVGENWLIKSNLNYRGHWGQGQFFQQFAQFNSSFDEIYQSIHLRPIMQRQGSLKQSRFLKKIGLDLRFQYFEQSNTIKSSNQMNAALFLTNHMVLAPKWQLDYGLRYAYIFTRGDFKSNPIFNNKEREGNEKHHQYAANIALTHNWSDQFSSTFSVSRAYQLPFIDQSSLTLNSQSDFGLEPETSYDYEITNSFKTSSSTHQLQIYFMEVTNKIVFDAQSGAYGANINIDQVYQYGLSFDSTYELSPSIQTGGSLVWQRNIIKSKPFENQTLPGSAPVEADLHLNWDVTSQFSIYIQQNFKSARYANSDFNNDLGKVSPVWLTNASMQYEWRQFKILLRINNLFDRFYNKFVTTSTGSSKSFHPADGINGFLSLKYTFDS